VFTHSSWAPDRTLSYERLEFLGDSVLELAVARALYDSHPDFSEVVARELDLGQRLLERGADALPDDELGRLVRNRNVLAALLEAALGALFLEHGFEKIEKAVVSAFVGRIDYALTTFVDHKTELQEALARDGRAVKYEVVEIEGPPHERRFTCAAFVDGEQLGLGSGASKKAAEQEAAQQALEALGLAPEPSG
jgi:ribonuclease-3